MIRQNGQPSLFTIFTSFLRLGSTAFGGAAMVAYIRRMAVQQKGWLDDASFRDGVAFCQTVPGATAMQVAAYSGSGEQAAWPELPPPMWASPFPPS